MKDKYDDKETAAIKTAMAASNRFLDSAKIFLAELNASETAPTASTRRAAMMRRSMGLTEALVALRKARHNG